MPTTKAFHPIRTAFNWQPLADPKLFERLCAFIFQRKLDDPHLAFVARNGKSQAGLDLVARNPQDQKLTGIQCKNYVKKFRPADVDKVLKVVDDAGNPFGITHLVIAVPLAADASCQAYVSQCSEARTAAGKFSVSLYHVGTIESDLSLIDSVEITRLFPELQNWQGGAWIKEHFPKHAIYAQIMEIGKRSRLHEGSHVVYKEFISPCFLDELVTDPFTNQGYRKHNEHIAFPIDGVHPRRFWVEAYFKAPSGYFRNCNRSVHVEGFHLRCGDHDSLHEIWSLLRDHSYETGSNAEHAFMISAGIMQSSLLKLRQALRATGAIRIVTPTTLMSDVMREFLLQNGFAEALGGIVLVDTP